MGKKMKSWSVLGVLLLVVLLLAACSGEANNADNSASSEGQNEQLNVSADQSSEEDIVQEGFQRYTNDKFDLSIDYPEDWTTKDVNETTFGFVSPKTVNEDSFMENVGVQVVSLNGQTVSLEEYANLLIDQAKTDISDFELISSETVPGEGVYVDTHYVTYDGSQGELQMSYESALIIDSHNDRAFVLTYSAEKDHFSDYVDRFYEMVNTFTF